MLETRNATYIFLCCAKKNSIPYLARRKWKDTKSSFMVKVTYKNVVDSSEMYIQNQPRCRPTTYGQSFELFIQRSSLEISRKKFFFRTKILVREKINIGRQCEVQGFLQFLMGVWQFTIQATGLCLRRHSEFKRTLRRMATCSTRQCWSNIYQGHHLVKQTDWKTNE